MLEAVVLLSLVAATAAGIALLTQSRATKARRLGLDMQLIDAALGATTATEALDVLDEAIRRRIGTRQFDLVVFDQRQDHSTLYHRSEDEDDQAPTRIDENDERWWRRAAFVASARLDAGIGDYFVVPVRLGDDVMGALRISGRVSVATRDELTTALSRLGALVHLRVLARPGDVFAGRRVPLSSLQRHDAVTRLENQDVLQTLLSEHLGAADQAIKTELTVAVADIDGFGEINELLGQPVADNVLFEAALRFRNALRPTDLAVRVKADEFAAVFLELPVVQVAPLAERLLAALSFDLVGHDDSVPPTSVTACLGLASATTGHDPEALIDTAYNALLQAKALGPGTWAYQTKAAGVVTGQSHWRPELS